eukprot:137783-Chlamydomonas_euryale.AAC.2
MADIHTASRSLGPHSQAPPRRFSEAPLRTDTIARSPAAASCPHAAPYATTTTPAYASCASEKTVAGGSCVFATRASVTALFSSSDAVSTAALRQRGWGALEQQRHPWAWRWGRQGVCSRVVTGSAAVAAENFKLPFQLAISNSPSSWQLQTPLPARKM